MSRITGIFHVNGNHWVAAVVDAGIEEFLYGDPMGNDIDTQLRGSLLWFLAQYIPDFNAHDIDDGILECPSQSISSDWFNCGIFSHNALAHHFLQHPLHQNTDNPIFGDLARLSLLQKLIKRHNSSVCD